MSHDSFSHFISVAIPRPVEGEYTYGVRDDWVEKIDKGTWVQVRFGQKLTHAFALNKPQEISQLPKDLKKIKLKEILDLSTKDDRIPEDILELCRWTSQYYQAPLGEVLGLAVPAAALGLKNKKREPRTIQIETDSETRTERIIALTDEQECALKGLGKLWEKVRDEKKTQVALLKGVTGSGKTKIYTELAKKVLSEGRSVLILVPEISLTPQLLARVQAELNEPVGAWHSAQPDGVRRDLWAAMNSEKLRVLVGARSALFSPLRKLGLIVVDEEHDSTYKQEERVRYHARDLSFVRGKISKALVVLGSATPSLETLEKADQKKYAFFELKKRVLQRALPDIQIVDLLKENHPPGLQAPFAEKTLREIQDTIQRGEQVLIYLNRRGYASFLICENCRTVEECPSCSISLTYHKKENLLKCHYCAYQTTMKTRCSSCGEEGLKPLGAGTESLEEQLPYFIPTMKPLRLDRDQVTSHSRLKKILNDFRNQKFNTLIGTQMLVKGHDFPSVTLVVVVLADSLFSWPDFRSSERALQVLTQISGRSGRATKKGKVIIQTMSPEHPVIAVLTAPDPDKAYRDFFDGEMDLRKNLSYPPYGRLAKVRIEHKNALDAKKRAQALVDPIKSITGLDILGPSEGFIKKTRNLYRWEFMLKSKTVAPVQKALRIIRFCAAQKKWSVLVDVDPQNIG